MSNIQSLSGTSVQPDLFHCTSNTMLTERNKSFYKMGNLEQKDERGREGDDIGMIGMNEER